MSDLTFSIDSKSDQEIILTQFETEQGWKVKIDLKTKDIWASTRDMGSLTQIHRDKITKGLEDGQALNSFLRSHDVSVELKQLKCMHSRMANCFNEKQILLVLEFYDCDMYKASKMFGFKTAILQSCGLLETPKPKQLSQTEVMLLMAPYVEIATGNPGLEQLVNKEHLIPCLYLTDKPFTLRHWVQIHHPGLDLSRGDMTRFGREFASFYRGLKTTQPENGYTDQSNKYTKTDHRLICQVFSDMLTSGRIG